jgi:hypothetical protein
MANGNGSESCACRDLKSLNRILRIGSPIYLSSKGVKFDELSCVFDIQS